MSLLKNFIHLYFFTEFEIMFYIYYILPYEKQLIYNMFSTSDNNYDNNYDVTTFLNTTKYDKQCISEQERLDSNNDKLWTYCLGYIITVNALLFLFFVKDFVVAYRAFYYVKETKYNSNSSLVAFGSINNLTPKYKKTDHVSFEIELIDLEKDLQLDLDLERNLDQHLDLEKNISIVKYNSFCIYYWKKSEFLFAIYKTVQFIIVIGIFEYLFFITIVNKYKVVNAKILLCKLLHK
jgi:hypothetical protein